MTTEARTHRRTLSGKRVPAEQHILSWLELVQAPPKPTGPKPRSGAHHAAMAALPTPESLAVTEFPEDYRGGRQRRRHAAYSTELRRRLGEALTARRERLHPQRVAERNARRQRKALASEQVAA